VRKIKEVLRLHALGLSQRQIALSCAVGQATVSDYLKAAETAGLKWADVADWDDDRLWKAVAPSRETPRSRIHPPEPDGYRYSRYCDLYRGWLRRQQVVLRHEHRAGEKLFVD
jgi:transposase